MAIVALGVGFFAGLKACQPAFLQTGNTYLQEHNFFDYQLISTLGLEEEDVDTIREVYQVGEAEGSYSADVLIKVGSKKSSEIGTKFITISKKINTPSLVSGKMPSKGSECLGDASFFSEDDIGRKIYVSSNNEEDTRDMLTYKSYTITGIANSPLFLNFERGSTSVGDGTVSGFVMLHPDGFSSDVYTEVYVTLANSAFIFTEEYETYLDEAEKPLENALKKCSKRRYNSIVNGAQDKVDDGRKELDEKKEEVEQADEAIKNGEETLESGRTLLEQNKSYYKTSLNQLESQKKLSYSQLELSYKLGMYTEQEYQKEKATLDKNFADAEKNLADMKKNIDDSEKELNDAEKELNDAKAEVADGKKELADAERKLAKAEKEIDDIENPSNYLLSRETNIGYACFDNDIAIVDGIDL